MKKKKKGKMDKKKLGKMDKRRTQAFAWGEEAF
jgi:hypothetical protein